MQSKAPVNYAQPIVAGIWPLPKEITEQFNYRVSNETLREFKAPSIEDIEKFINAYRILISNNSSPEELYEAFKVYSQITAEYPDLMFKAKKLLKIR